jgi:hypothetical protein
MEIKSSSRSHFSQGGAGQFDQSGDWQVDVEADALKRAGQKCLADSEVRKKTSQVKPDWLAQKHARISQVD